MSTSHWQTVPLSEIAEVRLGRQRSPKRAVGPNMRPYMRAANVTWQGISLHDVKEMDFTPDDFATYALQRGDRLLSEASGSASEVGKPAIWNDEVQDCCFQNTLIRVRAPEPFVPFLHLHFYKNALTGEFARAARGVGIHHLGAKTLSAWEIHLPPRDEQRRIVDALHSYFARLDATTATLERVYDNLRRYRASILRPAVDGRLVPSDAALAREEGRDYESASILLARILVDRRQRWEQSQVEKLSTAPKASTTHQGQAKYQEPATPDADTLPPLPPDGAGLPSTNCPTSSATATPGSRPPLAPFALFAPAPFAPWPSMPPTATGSREHPTTMPSTSHCPATCSSPATAARPASWESPHSSMPLANQWFTRTNSLKYGSSVLISIFHTWSSPPTPAHPGASSMRGHVPPPGNTASLVPTSGSSQSRFPLLANRDASPQP